MERTGKGNKLLFGVFLIRLPQFRGRWYVLELRQRSLAAVEAEKIGVILSLEQARNLSSYWI